MSDLQTLAAAVRGATSSPFIPGAVRELLPVLMRVLIEQQAQIQELRELVQPPCEGCGGRV